MDIFILHYIVSIFLVYFLDIYFLGIYFLYCAVIFCCYFWCAVKVMEEHIPQVAQMRQCSPVHIPKITSLPCLSLVGFFVTGFSLFINYIFHFVNPASGIAVAAPLFLT